MEFTKNEIKEYEELAGADVNRADFLYNRRFSFSKELINFYLDILNNQDEYDLSRIEAAKNIQDHYDTIPSDKKITDNVIDSLVTIILHDSDDVVRCYAAITLSAFVEYRPLISSLKNIILNPKEDDNLRACIFDIVSKQKHTTEGKEVLIALLDDATLKKSAKRVLSE